MRVPAISLDGRIAREDVARIAVAVRTAVVGCAADVVRCDVRATWPVALPTIDVLARIALEARRSRRDIRLEHASPAILELLELCGLRALIAGVRPGGDQAER